MINAIFDYIDSSPTRLVRDFRLFITGMAIGGAIITPLGFIWLATR